MTAPCCSASLSAWPLALANWPRSASSSFWAASRWASAAALAALTWACSLCSCCSCWVVPVSYTHLDVYKRQGVQLAYSVARVLTGFLLAALAAIPLGFLIGMSKTVYRAFDPFIQVLKPISPLAWMPLALYTIKDADTSAIFVIFILSLIHI